eukprot:212552_1
MSNKSTKAELKQLQELKSQLELQQKKINAQRSKLKKEKDNIDAENKKIASKRKQLQKDVKTFQNDKILQEKRNTTRARRSSSNASKPQKEFFEINRKYEKEVQKSTQLQKKSSALQKQLHEIQAQNNVLSLKIENLSGKRQTNTTDPRLRQLIVENRELRKKLRKTFLVIKKEKRWYQRTINIFKTNQNKWIEKQRAIFKDKNIIIKYVFVDDIKYIKQYQKHKKSTNENSKPEFRNKVKFKMKNGGETTKSGVEIIVLDPELIDNDSNGSGTKSQAGGEEIDKLMDDLMEEFGITNNEVSDDEDEIKSVTSDVEDDLDDEKEYMDDNYDAQLLKENQHEEIISLQKRLANLQEQIESKDAMIVSLRKTMESKSENGKLNGDEIMEVILEDEQVKINHNGNVQEDEKNDANEFVYMDEYDTYEYKDLSKKKRKNYNSKLNIVISHKLDIIKQEVKLGHVVTDSPFKWEDQKSKKLERQLKNKANPLKTEISVLKTKLEKLTKENENLKKKNAD